MDTPSAQSIVETVATTAPTGPGGVWRTLTAGDGTGPHDIADLVIDPTGRNQLLCRCGTTLGAAAYTLGYRLGVNEVAGRSDTMRQHLRATSGLCVHCGKATCWCHMTVGS